MTGSFIVNRRAAILRVLLVLAITFTLGFLAGRVSAAPRSGPNVIPATPATAGESDPSGLIGALPSLEVRWLSELAGGPIAVPLILGGGASHVPTETASPGVAVDMLSRSGSGSTPGGRSTLRGMATWYRWHPGEAAAGPALRAFLGNWRGQTVTVCAATCFRVRLSDWCLCGGGRIIDLDARSFARLASLSRGIVRITLWR